MKNKWFSRKLILVAVFDAAMIALSILFPPTATAALSAARDVTLLFVGAQAAQNSVGIVTKILGKKKKPPADESGDKLPG